jgi:uncharacterized protein involved in outer membrane biogenesis
VDVVLWKWIVSILFTLIAGLILTAYGILSRCDVNRFKPLIIEQVKKATGRDLKLGGEIALAIGLRPALVVDGVFFENAPWALYPQMVKVKRFEMQGRSSSSAWWSSGPRCSLKATHRASGTPIWDGMERNL